MSPRTKNESQPDEDEYGYMEAESIEDADYDEEEDEEYEEDDHEPWYERYDPDTGMGKIMHFIGREETAPHAHLGMLLTLVALVAIVVAVIG